MAPRALCSHRRSFHPPRWPIVLAACCPATSSSCTSPAENAGGLGSSRPPHAASSHAAQVSRMTGIQSTVRFQKASQAANLSRYRQERVSPTELGLHFARCRPAHAAPSALPTMSHRPWPSLTPRRAPISCVHDPHPPAMQKRLHIGAKPCARALLSMPTVLLATQQSRTPSYLCTPASRASFVGAIAPQGTRSQTNASPS